MLGPVRSCQFFFQIPSILVMWVSSLNFFSLLLKPFCRGGHEAVRHIWEDYAAADNISAILFLIDAADSIRLVDEVRDELDHLVHEGILGDVPVAILLNKCDLGEDRVMNNEQVAAAIGYYKLRQRHGEDKMEMFRMSVLRGEGYQEAIRWIASFL